MFHVIYYTAAGERFSFRFTSDYYTETLRQFGRFAANPKINFSWWDAAVLTKRVRTMRDAAVLQSSN